MADRGCSYIIEWRKNAPPTVCGRRASAMQVGPYTGVCYEHAVIMDTERKLGVITGIVRAADGTSTEFEF